MYRGRGDLAQPDGTVKCHNSQRELSCYYSNGRYCDNREQSLGPALAFRPVASRNAPRSAQ